MARYTYNNTRHVKDLSQKLLNNYFRRRGLVDSDFVFRWKEIVGSYFAPYSYPVKFDFPKKGEYRDGTLTLYVDRGAALEFEHQKERLIERINQYFGYRMVDRLIFKQGYFQHKNSTLQMQQNRRPVFKKDEVEDIVQHVENEEIKEALKRLGQAMKR
jgi:hypothetical protein